MAPLVFDAAANNKLRRFHLTFGRSHSDIRWTDRRDYSFSELSGLLASATVGGKDGACYTPATFSGSMRRKDQACQIDIAALDSDCGHSMNDIKDAVARLGWRAIIHSTHSHMSNQTLIKADAAEKWMNAEPGRDIAGYMLFKRGYLPHIIEKAHIVDETSEGDVRHFIVKHEPCPKFRILIPLDTPWLADEYESQQIANATWRDRIAALAFALGLSMDQSCVDTSRLFYLPRLRHEGQEFLHCTLDGEDCPIWGLPDASTEAAQNSEGLFAWEASQPVPHSNVVRLPIEGKKNHKTFVDSKTGEVFDLTSWAAKYALRFEVVDALRDKCPQIFSPRRNGVKHHIICPNSASHFTSGAEGSGTYAVNASQINVSGLSEINGGFVIHCMHNGCSGLDRLDHLGALLADGLLGVEALTDSRFLAPEKPLAGFRQGAGVAGAAGAAGAPNGSGGLAGAAATGGEIVVISRATRELRGPDFGTDPGNIPASLYSDLPGILGRIHQWMLDTAKKPQPSLALGASLAFCAAAIGRKVKLQSWDTQPNIYALGVARSGAGKDRPMKACKELAFRAGLSDELIGVEEVASDSGIVTSVIEHPHQLMLVDEVSSLLSAASNQSSGMHITGVITMLLKLYSSSDSFFKGKSYADKDNNKKVNKPCVSFFGCCVPTELQNALTSRDVNSGLLSRMVIFDAGDNDPRMVNVFGKNGEEHKQTLEEIDNWIKAWDKMNAGNPLKRVGGEQVLQQSSVMITEDANRMVIEFEGEMHEAKKQAIPRGKDALYVRAVENALKFALIRACAAVPATLTEGGSYIDESALKVDATTMRWAIDLSRCTVERMDKITDEIVDSQFQQQQKQLRKLIQQAGEKGATRYEMARTTAGRHPERLMIDLMTSLELSGEIKEILMKTNGRQRKAWVYKAYFDVHNVKADDAEEESENGS